MKFLWIFSSNPQIPEKLKNLGMGDRLANAALDYAMERGMKVRLTHPFLRFPPLAYLLLEKILFWEPFG